MCLDVLCCAAQVLMTGIDGTSAKLMSAGSITPVFKAICSIDEVVLSMRVRGRGQCALLVGGVGDVHTVCIVVAGLTLHARRDTHA
jgi:hypothetical protein